MDQEAVNRRLWAAVGDDLVAEYAAHALRPVEQRLLERCELGGRRVLEVGAGSGRLTRELVGRGAQVVGIDLSPAMVARCRGQFPAARFEVLDMTDVGGFAAGAFDVIVAGYNVLDVLGHERRLEVLRVWRRLLAPGGALVFSSHNRHHEPFIPSPLRLRARNPRRVLGNLRRLRRRLRNHRRLAPLEQRHEGWAVLNDEAHDHGLLHYYVSRDEAARQLDHAGFALVEALDLAGAPVGTGETAGSCPELHYLARAAA